jgi:hypothetical protein
MPRGWWSIFHMSNKLSSWIFSERWGETLMLGLWLQIITKGSAIGVFGLTISPHSVVWMPCSPQWCCQTPNGIELLLGFAHQIKWGHERDGSKVRAGSMQVVLHAIGKTLNLDGQPNPTYCSEGKYWLKIG